MDKIDIFSMAYKNLMRRKARTFLTVLGVLIGTTAIIVMISLGIGQTETTKRMIEQWGSLNQVEVNAGYISADGEGAVVLNDEAIENFKAMEGVVAVVPQIQLNNGLDTKWGKMMGYLQVYGIEPSAMEQLEYKLGGGRFLQEGDRNAIVLGYQVSDNFYDPDAAGDRWGPDYVYDPEAIYQTTLSMLNARLSATATNYETDRTKKINIEVVGVLSRENAGASWYAYMPIDTVRQLQKFTARESEKKNKNKNMYSSVIVLTDDVEHTKAISQNLKDQGYYAYTIADSLDGIEQQSKVSQAILGGIGAITLLVAAIGIVNTMIMSIYERTREIGIMKVIGATFTDIRLLFLTEAGLIGLFGGLIGLALSFGLSHLINTVGAGFLGGGGDVATEAVSLSVIPPWLVVFALVFSIMIGVLAGIYPANRAVKLSPIEAMRNNN